MTEQEQRIAIAKACGWKIEFDNSGVTPPRFDQYIPRGYKPVVDLLPDYLHDLNAMHEAEKTLEGESCRLFIGYLVTVLKPGEFSVRAAAGQRAEAFLRTIGKWED